ncbi:MAG: aminodeoxychorismate lyase [Flammeovirgaceae bacterium TMED32]|nr:MAG: aminodeoxychorismate lyase [Flammeovirgaceae bacterium TMED32]|tara:strand:- start:1897 stop:2931 length:1035 start_codon:yes stop_codon:yes gene_type:complete
MKNKKFLAVGLIIGSMLVSSFSFYFWQVVYTPNILIDKEDLVFNIPTGANFKYVQNSLYDLGIVNDLVSFSFLSKLKRYDQSIKPGSYLLQADMSNRDAINMLRSGDQVPIKLTYSNARSLEVLAAKIASYLEFDSATMMSNLSNNDVASSYGLTKETFMCMFLPNTYEVYITDQPIVVLDRIYSAYKIFWNPERMAKAKAINLTPEEVIVLASIVDAETNQMDEAPTVAGVYINRLNKNIKLQADPTLIFALGDYTIKRVLYEHMQVDSPYNTYKYAGLPPGPINLPSISAIEAVLNYEKSDYLYFCANPDFTGNHIFARTLSQHNKNARLLHLALNKKKIYK